MKIVRALFSALLLLVAAPAWADTTALYKSPKLGAEMRIEVAANGDMRSSVGGSGAYYLTAGGEDYIVFFTDKGPVVDRMSDVITVMKDYMEKMSPGFGKVFASDDAPAFKFIQGGQMTVQGRPGIVWYQTFGDDDISFPMDALPKIVISADPALAELGRGWIGQLERMSRMAPPGFGGGRNEGMLAVLKTGAPLMINGMELVEVSHAPIPVERFALPAPPETREQVKIRFETSGGHIP